MKILITGGAGFVGSNFVHYVLKKHTDWSIVNLDKLNYAGRLENVADLKDNPRHHFIKGDFTNARLVNSILKEKFNLIVNFGAETHVDRSFIYPSIFAKSNALGTQTLLEGARKYGIDKFIHISTPEVYGGIASVGQKFTEQSPFKPTNPYSASKAAADIFCLAYFHTYGVPVSFTRFANVYGPRQYPEKLVPVSITRALQDKPIPLFGSGQFRRNWIYIDDVCHAIDMIIQKGRPGEAYNIGSGYEMTNLDLVHQVLDILQKPNSLITYAPDRPSHDYQYPLDSAKITSELGWKLEYPFDLGIRKTVEWYKKNQTWWENIRFVDYGKYYKKILAEKGKN